MRTTMTIDTEVDCNVLSYEESKRIFGDILSADSGKDRELSDLIQLMISRAIKYSEERMNWSQMTKQEQIAADENRSRIHDLFIISVTKLSEYMYKNKYGNRWEDLLGSDRKRIGDFACYLAYTAAINER